MTRRRTRLQLKITESSVTLVNELAYRALSRDTFHSSANSKAEVKATDMNVRPTLRIFRNDF